MIRTLIFVALGVIALFSVAVQGVSTARLLGGDAYGGEVLGVVHVQDTRTQTRGGGRVPVAFVLCRTDLPGAPAQADPDATTVLRSASYSEIRRASSDSGPPSLTDGSPVLFWRPEGVQGRPLPGALPTQHLAIVEWGELKSSEIERAIGRRVVFSRSGQPDRASLRVPIAHSFVVVPIVCWLIALPLLGFYVNDRKQEAAGSSAHRHRTWSIRLVLLSAASSVAILFGFGMLLPDTRLASLSQLTVVSSLLLLPLLAQAWIICTDVVSHVRDR